MPLPWHTWRFFFCTFPLRKKRKKNGHSQFFKGHCRQEKALYQTILDCRGWLEVRASLWCKFHPPILSVAKVILVRVTARPKPPFFQPHDSLSCLLLARAAFCRSTNYCVAWLSIVSSSLCAFPAGMLKQSHWKSPLSDDNSLPVLDNTCFYQHTMLTYQTCTTDT